MTIYKKNSGEKAGKIGTRIEKTVKCGYCGKSFKTTQATFEEAFGRDGAEDTSF